MNEYKLVPVKPTPEMVSKGARLLQIMSLPEREAASVFRAMLAAAPDIRREPVGYVSPRLLDTLRSGKACGITMEDKPDAHNGVTTPLYAAPQPVEQAELVGWQFYQDDKWWNGDDRIKDHRKNTEAAGIPVRDVYAAVPAVQGEAVAWTGWGCQYPGKIPRLYGDRRIAELNCDWENGDQVLHFTAAPQLAEQQPTPDVTQLVEALERIATWPDGGEKYGKMTVKIFASKALATYRNQGGEL